MKNYNQFIKENVNNSDKYIIGLNETEYKNILTKNCTTYLKNNIYFYRGDKQLDGDYYLINSKKTITQLKYNYNYIATEFVSSDLWKNKNLPLKKNSLNMSTDIKLSNTYGTNSYKVIPFDNAKIVCLPKEFGVCPNKILENELDLFEEPYALSVHLSIKSGYDNININNISNVIKKLENIYDNNIGDMDDKDKQIIHYMNVHNMSFKEYMEYVFAPENYDIINYNNMTNQIINNYVAGYTDSPVLLVKTNINEHMTNTGRWGNIGAGILPYCKKTKRFLLAFRSSYVLEPHTWGIWGGKIEDNEDIEESAIREFEEESGYNNTIKLIPSYIYKERGFTYHNFIGLIEDEFEPGLDWENERGVVETEDYKWVTLDELLKIEPKHFGLEKLLDNNINQIKNI